MERKKVLVCGATGFLGRNVSEYLATKPEYEVFGTYNNKLPFENANIKYLKADLTEKKDVSSVINGFDVVVQMAAITSGANDIFNQPHIHIADNAVMNSLILRATFDNKIPHFIFPSCSIMYQSSEEPIKETDFDPNAEIIKNYFGPANNKIYLENMCKFYSRLDNSNTKFTVMRHSNIYGPYDKFDLKRSHVFGATMTKVMKNTSGEITVWGDGSEQRDLLYVDDLLEFIDLSIKKQTERFALYNVGLGKPTSVSDLVKKIVDVSGKDIKLNYDLSKPTIKTNIHLDCSKVKKELGWEAKTTLEEGIRKTMHWYRKNIL